MKIKKKAIHLKQNGSKITVLSLTANELITNTRVDRFNSNLELLDENNGYQRPATPSRVKKLGNLLHRNQVEEKNFPMPTAVLFSDRGVNINYGDDYIEFDSNDCFPIIDGQHRISGLRYAIEEKNNEILGYWEYPVVIIHELEKIKEMQQFSVVNSTAKSVNTALVNYQLSQIQEAMGDESLKENEKWRVIGAKILKNLNSNKNSIWFERILMPDQHKYSQKEINDDPTKAKKRITTATSFIVSLRPIISNSEKNILRGKNINEKVEVLTRVVEAWWSALSELMPDAFENPSNYVIQKTAGIFSMHLVLRDKLYAANIAALDIYSKKTYLDMFKGDYECLKSIYWSTDKEESAAEAQKYGSMAGFKELYINIDDELMSV